MYVCPSPFFSETFSEILHESALLIIFTILTKNCPKLTFTVFRLALGKGWKPYFCQKFKNCYYFFLQKSKKYISAKKSTFCPYEHLITPLFPHLNFEIPKIEFFRIFVIFSHFNWNMVSLLEVFGFQPYHNWPEFDHKL